MWDTWDHSRTCGIIAGWDTAHLKDALGTIGSMGGGHWEYRCGGHQKYGGWGMPGTAGGGWGGLWGTQCGRGLVRPVGRGCGPT